ncbi:MAG: DUF2190 family protein [Oxalobacteraceae bacterium]|nr:DUF2190 family protein [Oxalobacteraceae bacterium]
MSKQAIALLTLCVAVAPSAVAEYRAVDFAGAQATVQGQKVAGVANRGALAGDGYEYTALGTAVVEAGAAIAAGDSLIVDAQGRAITSTGPLALAAGAVAVTSVAANGASDLVGGDSPEYVFADALQAAAAAGDFIEVLLRR